MSTSLISTSTSSPLSARRASHWQMFHSPVRSLTDRGGTIVTSDSNRHSSFSLTHGSFRSIATSTNSKSNPRGASPRIRISNLELERACSRSSNSNSSVLLPWDEGARIRRKIRAPPGTQPLASPAGPTNKKNLTRHAFSPAPRCANPAKINENPAAPHTDSVLLSIAKNQAGARTEPGRARGPGAGPAQHDNQGPFLRPTRSQVASETNVRGGGLNPVGHTWKKDY